MGMDGKPAWVTPARESHARPDGCGDHIYGFVGRDWTTLPNRLRFGNRSTVDIDRRSGHKLKKSVDLEFAYPGPYFIIPTDQNEHNTNRSKQRSLLF